MGIAWKAQLACNGQTVDWRSLSDHKFTSTVYPLPRTWREIGKAFAVNRYESAFSLSKERRVGGKSVGVLSEDCRVVRGEDVPYKGDSVIEAQ
jgi:hypothetical protein